MSFIPARKMPHITARSGEFDAETGKIVHLHPEASSSLLDRLPSASSLPKVPMIGWIAGGAGLAAAALGATLFALRSSSSRKPTRRPTRTTTAKRAAPRRRTTTAKRKTAA